MIETKDIDVIIQGNIDERCTREVCESVRKELRGSHIILSTWKEDIEKARELESLRLIDEYVVSEDPGTKIQNYYSHAYINLDRQIVSTRAALEKLTRKYTLKLRTDIKILSNYFLERYDQTCLQWAARRKKQYQVFGNFVLVSSFFCRNPRIVPMAYHMSDWISFGMTDDIKLIYEIEKPDEKFYSWFASHRKETWLYKDYICKLCAEQYFVLMAMKKRNMKMAVPSKYYDLNRNILKDSERVAANNYIIDDYQNGSFQFMKYNPNRFGDSMFCYRNSDLELVRKYLDKTSVISKLGYGLYMCKCIVFKVVAFILLGLVSNFLRATNLKKKVRKILEKKV